jgi:DNA-binding NarL/FixJ family response regulator
VVLTVLIVDDHGGFRRSARALLAAEGFDVVAEAADAAAAVEAVERHRPALVLLDIQLPDRDGFAVADQLARRAEPPAVILISSREAGAYGDRVALAPARGFLAKRDLGGEAIRRLLR